MPASSAARAVLLRGAPAGGFPYGTPLIMAGDSITDADYSTAGFAARTIAKLRGRYVSPVCGNRGSAGAPSLSNVKDIPFILELDGGPGVVVLLTGGNTDTGGAAATVTNIRTFINAMLNAGHRVIMLPYYNFSATGTVNASVHSSTDVTVINTELFMSSASTADEYDGTHPGDFGGEKLSDQLVQLLNLWSAAPNQDCYTNDVTTNLINGNLTGSGGSTSFLGTAPSGTIPTGVQAALFSGNGTLTLNPLVDGPAGALDIIVTGNTTATRVVLEFTNSITPALDDHFEAYLEYKQISGAVNEWWLTVNSNVAGHVGDTFSYNSTLMNDYRVIRTWTKPANVSSGSVTLRLFLTVPAGTSATTRIRRPRMIRRTVANYPPRLYFNGGTSILPEVTGTAKVGQTLTVNTSTWYTKPMPVTKTFLWTCGDSSTPGATATNNTYVPVSGDIGKTMICTTTATGSSGARSWKSEPTAAVVA